MKPRSADLLALLSVAAMGACVSFDPSAPGGAPEIGGVYAATVVTRIANGFETQSDSFDTMVILRSTGVHGGFTGTYEGPGADSGPVGGEFVDDDGRLFVTVFGEHVKPVAGVAQLSARYPWCEFPLLGLPPVYGQLTADTLRFSAEGSLPCLYDVGVSVRIQTEFSISVSAVR